MATCCFPRLTDLGKTRYLVVEMQSYLAKIFTDEFSLQENIKRNPGAIFGGAEPKGLGWKFMKFSKHPQKEREPHVELREEEIICVCGKHKRVPKDVFDHNKNSGPGFSEGVANIHNLTAWGPIRWQLGLRWSSDAERLDFRLHSGIKYTNTCFSSDQKTTIAGLSSLALVLSWLKNDHIVCIWEALQEDMLPFLMMFLLTIRTSSFALTKLGMSIDNTGVVFVGP